MEGKEDLKAEIDKLRFLICFTIIGVALCVAAIMILGDKIDKLSEPQTQEQATSE